MTEAPAVPAVRTVGPPRRSLRALALILAGAAVLLVPATVLLSLGGSATEDVLDVTAFALFVVLLVFPLTGALLALRVPRNPMGWIFIAIGLLFLGGVASEEYAVRALVRAPDSLPAGVGAAWLTTWMWTLWLGLLPVAIALFPDGRLPAPRWWPLLATAASWTFPQAALNALRPGPLQIDRLPDIPNPFGWQALAGFDPVLERTWYVYLLAIVGSLAALTARFRRARGLERLQLRAFAYAAALVAFMAIGNALLEVVEQVSGADLTLAADIMWIGMLAAICGLPLAATISILRYRLYDIDLLINRTLVYGAVTALLAGTYFGAVLVIQAALRPFTAGSELAVAASTLLVVALFQPLRRRVQEAVDHRFYRSRYDATRTIDAFRSRLRDQVELDAVQADLLGIVHETIRPAHARLWLR